MLKKVKCVKGTEMQALKRKCKLSIKVKKRHNIVHDIFFSHASIGWE